METKQELRDEINRLQTEIYELKKENEEYVKVHEELESFKEKHDIYVNYINKLKSGLIDFISIEIQKQIDQSIRKISLNLNCDYGGYISASLRYKGQKISDDSETIMDYNNPEDE